MNKTLRLFGLLLSISLFGCGEEKGPETVSVEQASTSSDAGQPVADENQVQSLLERCAECHGADGVSNRNGAPFIAGQHETYLLAAMESYLNGNRHFDGMKAALESVTLGDLKGLANHYAGLASPWNPPREQQERASAAAPSKQSIAAGKVAAKPCAGCHGENGNSTITGMPSLAGLQPVYLRSALNAYLDGRRSDTIMVNFRLALKEQDVKNLVAYFSAQTRYMSTLPASGDVAKGKLAAKSCVGCHGVEGNSVHPALPSISGQNADYLIKAITDYRDGRRKNEMMSEATSKLDDQTIANLAAFYAAQQPAELSQMIQASGSGFDPVGDGERIAATCNGCHGDDGNSQTPGTPSLNRQPVGYLAGAIRSYRDGGRKHELMRGFVASLGDEEAEKIAFYYALQEPAVSKAKHKGDAQAGEAVAEGCKACHGEKGNSGEKVIPTLAGQDALYLQQAIDAYAKGSRSNADMKNAAVELSKQQVLDVAAYYAQQVPVKPKVRLPEAPEVLALRCNRCHGENGFSTDPTKPRLAGQVSSYLAKALQDYQNGARENSTMHAMSEILSLVEIKAIAAYYSQQTQ